MSKPIDILLTADEIKAIDNYLKLTKEINSLQEQRELAGYVLTSKFKSKVPFNYKTDYILKLNSHGKVIPFRKKNK